MIAINLAINQYLLYTQTASQSLIHKGLGILYYQLAAPLFLLRAKMPVMLLVSAVDFRTQKGEMMKANNKSKFIINP